MYNKNKNIPPFGGIFKNKKVLITGHTGFKGSWLTTWLIKLGANVYGISDQIPTKPSMFEVAKIEKKINHAFCDVCDLDSLFSHVSNIKPNFIFHLAAQSVVSVSQKDPVNTIRTNVMGTVNMLEVLKLLDLDCTAIFITSDKCYENIEWEWGYREIDQLGGADIYSGSKAAAEIVINSYHCSFFSNNKTKIASARAGNVIGGGDWTKDRIVVDCMKMWSSGKPVLIRRPNSTRPWQHVLEPLSGYLTLAEQLSRKNELAGQSFNFGPDSNQNRTVLELLKDLSNYWKFQSTSDIYKIESSSNFHEANLLKLNCDKALAQLNWYANLKYSDCVKLVSEWYYDFYQNNNDNIYDLNIKQIDIYEKLAMSKGLSWIKN